MPGAFPKIVNIRNFRSKKKSLISNIIGTCQGLEASPLKRKGLPLSHKRLIHTTLQFLLLKVSTYTFKIEKFAFEYRNERKV